jgi:D-lactate dehydrogenase
MANLTGWMRKVSPQIPLWKDILPVPPSLKLLQKETKKTGANIVYFPSCISRMLGTYPNQQKNALEVFLSVAQKANIQVKVLENVSGSCCSQIFGSKGFKNAQAFTANQIIDRLWASSEEGKLPIVNDVSSCTYTLHHLKPFLNPENKVRFNSLQFLDTVDFLHDLVLPKMEVRQKKKQIVLHPVCSLEKMKTSAKFLAVANQLAEKVNLPISSGCCGMAGDRGFLYPELTQSATLPEATEANQTPSDGYYSTTRTCEMALTEATKKNYESILYLVDEAL